MSCKNCGGDIGNLDGIPICKECGNLNLSEDLRVRCTVYVHAKGHRLLYDDCCYEISDTGILVIKQKNQSWIFNTNNWEHLEVHYDA